ncbi:MAG: RecX family transcriptional regulator [Candidatus Sumerlaeota bacterium]|nr:RecX family transcriptional regulator [Candidatus Sumerlaeota bacterium]
MPFITDLKLAKSRAGIKTEVWLDGVLWRRIEADMAFRFHLKTGMELSEERLSEIEAEDEALRARQAVARYTALTMRSRRQCETYLRRRGFAAEISTQAAQYAQDYEWINDERYAGAFIRQRNALRPAGPARLRAELAAKGIEESAVEAALAQFGPDETAQRLAAQRAAGKRLASWKGRFEIPELRKKLRDYLIRQGYEPTIAREVAGEAGEEATEEKVEETTEEE